VLQPLQPAPSFAEVFAVRADAVPVGFAAGSPQPWRPPEPAPSPMELAATSPPTPPAAGAGPLCTPCGVGRVGMLWGDTSAPGSAVSAVSDAAVRLLLEVARGSPAPTPVFAATPGADALVELDRIEAEWLAFGGGECAADGRSAGRSFCSQWLCVAEHTFVTQCGRWTTRASAARSST
jgi:hypothetical protein